MESGLIKKFLPRITLSSSQYREKIDIRLNLINVNCYNINGKEETRTQRRKGKNVKVRKKIR
jgi:hypothetical protein